MVSAATKHPAGSLLEALDYVPEDEATAIALDITLPTLVGYRRQGVGPEFALVGRKIYYSKKALKKWLAAGGVKGATVLT